MKYYHRSNYINLDTDSHDTNLTRIRIFKVMSCATVFIVVLSVIQIIGFIKIVDKNSDILLLQENYVIENEAETKNFTTQQVEIEDGILEGISLKSRRGRNYTAFYNIPYAKPAVGKLRFEPPQEFTEGWTGIRDATKKGPKCVQRKISSSTKVSGEEDCHYLTVFTSNIPEYDEKGQRSLLPVMVYLLGGAFIGGQASIYGGDYLMDKDVIIVLPETRFGTMGFFSTGDHVAPGNNGFKDQVMALKWVQANIAKFGGDPKKVTIFGNSSGAISIHLHMMSSMSKGLFHRAISQSGAALMGQNGVLILNPKERAFELGNQLGCASNSNSNDTQELVNCLRQIDAVTLVKAQDRDNKAFVVETEIQDGVVLPVKTQIQDGVFLSDTPLNIMTQGRVHENIPWIIGVNSNEYNVMAAILNDSAQISALNKNWEESGVELLDVENIEMLRQIREFYFGNKNITMETWNNYTNMINDRKYIHPVYTTAKMHATNSPNNHVYLYCLTKKPIKSLGSSLEDMFEPPYGVTHADEVQYLFPYKKFPYIGLNAVDLKMSETMVDIWTHFADKGKPYEEWTQVPSNAKGKDVAWFQLNDELKMADFFGERMTFWDKFPLQELYLQNVP